MKRQGERDLPFFFCFVFFCVLCSRAGKGGAYSKALQDDRGLTQADMSTMCIAICFRPSCRSEKAPEGSVRFVRSGRSARSSRRCSPWWAWASPRPRRCQTISRRRRAFGRAVSVVWFPRSMVVVVESNNTPLICRYLDVGGIAKCYHGKWVATRVSCHLAKCQDI